MSGAILLTDGYGGNLLKFPLINRPTPLISAMGYAFGWGRKAKKKAMDTFGYSGGRERPTLETDNDSGGSTTSPGLVA